MALAAPANVPNPVLTAADIHDLPASFVADPFLIHREGRWYMFFEVLNGLNRLGQIALARSDDGIEWAYQRVVLKERFHLAYPYVFEAGGDVFMVPDTPDHGIRLYRATCFPYRWELIGHLRSDNRFSDSSLFQFAGRWWMLSGWRAKPTDRMSLRLFHADQPAGPWSEHPASPVVSRDDRISRPAGRVLNIDGHLYRFTQDCGQAYGQSVRMLRIDRLTDREYVEREVSSEPVLGRGLAWWNSGGMHHIDAFRLDSRGWIACVDGWHLPKGAPAAQEAEGRRELPVASSS